MGKKKVSNDDKDVDLNGEFDVVLTLEELKEESEAEFDDVKSVGDPVFDNVSSDYEHDDQQISATKSYELADLLRYGPILVFVIAIVFFLLPSLLSTNGNTNNSSDWNTIEARLSDAQRYNDEDKASFMELETADPETDGRSAYRERPASMLADVSEAQLLNRINPHSYQYANAHAGVRAENSGHDPAEDEQSESPVATENSQRIISLESQQADLRIELREYYESLSSEMARLSGLVSTSSVALKTAVQNVADTNHPTKVTLSSIYVLDTTNTKAGDSHRMSTSKNPTIAVQNAKLLFDGVLLHSISGDYLNFIASNCDRFSRKIGGHIYGFGTIVSQDGIEVYSTSKRFIRTGNYRQCSRSVLVGDAQSKSNGEPALRATQNNSSSYSNDGDPDQIEDVLAAPSILQNVIAVPVQVVR